MIISEQCIHCTEEETLDFAVAHYDNFSLLTITAAEQTGRPTAVIKFFLEGEKGVINFKNKVLWETEATCK